MACSTAGIATALEKLLGLAILGNAALFVYDPLSAVALYLAHPNTPEAAMGVFSSYGGFAMFLGGLMWNPLGGKCWAVSSLTYAAVMSYLIGSLSVLPCEVFGLRCLPYILLLVGIGFFRAQDTTPPPETTSQLGLCKALALIYIGNGAGAVYFPGPSAAQLGASWYCSIFLDYAALMLAASSVLLMPGNSCSLGASLIAQGLLFATAHLGVSERFMEFTYVMIPYVTLMIGVGAWLLISRADFAYQKKEETSEHRLEA
eukprot:TRINITY_DN5483_c0_g2_i1.p1 TRINITY_DN5483_c0_g2~~TRINITY_DN5483_c0_g2_i1.p1  ORF type:complete len:259 (-),score=53.53 TRINITY_DN5483_c0_g2_i1:333-1109(-)